MKYNIGDKVKIRRDLVAGKAYGDNTYIDIMEQDAKSHDYVLTVNRYTWNDTQYSMLESGFNWTEEMIEGLVENKELNKFEAFLREVVNENSPEYCNEWRYVCHLTDGEDVDENVAYLVEFYKTFEPKPKPQPKKFTMAELRDIVGEDFEIVD